MIVLYDDGERGWIDTVFDGLDEYWVCNAKTKELVFQACGAGDLRSYKAAELTFTGEWSRAVEAEAVVQVPPEVIEKIADTEDWESTWEEKTKVVLQIEHLVSGAPGRILIGPGFTPDVKAAERMLIEHVRELIRKQDVSETIEVGSDVVELIQAEENWEAEWEEQADVKVKLEVDADGFGRITVGPGFKSVVTKAVALLSLHLQELGDGRASAGLDAEPGDVTAEDIQKQLEQLKREQEEEDKRAAQEAEEEAAQAEALADGVVEDAEAEAGAAEGAAEGAGGTAPSEAPGETVPPRWPKQPAAGAAFSKSAGFGQAPPAKSGKVEAAVSKAGASSLKTRLVAVSSISQGSALARAARAKLAALDAGEAEPEAEAPPAEEPPAEEPPAEEPPAERPAAEAPAEGEAGAKEPGGGEGGAAPAEAEAAQGEAAAGAEASTESAPADAPQAAGESATQGAAAQPSMTIQYWLENQEQFSHLTPLPPNWIRIKSQSMGYIYYANLADGTTTLQEPGKEPPQAPLPEGWTEVTSRSTGQIYYWHSATGHSQFIRPL